ncbi:hypothetical protein CI238_03593 [Colletotrichum incanum]|uniref:Uncharacterized protein n=1 Tax=Colletotrichum incanum TaxID=1573173 RepID=A0A167DW44_COLIC|nr:hypothetical protein CI238_03593 [Colletotrichum incanum]
MSSYSGRSVYHGYCTVPAAGLVKGQSSAKPPHTHSTAESQRLLSQRRLNSYQTQPPSQDSSTYRISYQGTNVSSRTAQHQARIAAEMARISGHYNGSGP